MWDVNLNSINTLSGSAGGGGLLLVVLFEGVEVVSFLHAENEAIKTAIISRIFNDFILLFFTFFNQVLYMSFTASPNKNTAMIFRKSLF